MSSGQGGYVGGGRGAYNERDVGPDPHHRRYPSDGRSPIGRGGGSGRDMYAEPNSHSQPISVTRGTVRSSSSGRLSSTPGADPRRRGSGGQSGRNSPVPPHYQHHSPGQHYDQYPPPSPYSNSPRDERDEGMIMPEYSHHSPYHHPGRGGGGEVRRQVTVPPQNANHRGGNGEQPHPSLTHQPSSYRNRPVHQHERQQHFNQQNEYSESGRRRRRCEDIQDHEEDVASFPEPPTVTSPTPSSLNSNQNVSRAAGVAPVPPARSTSDLTGFRQNHHDHHYHQPHPQPDNSVPSPPDACSRASSERIERPQVDDEKLMLLMSMGFTVEHATEALKLCSNDLERAANYLAQRTELDSATVQAMSNELQETGGATPIDAGNPPPPRLPPQQEHAISPNAREHPGNSHMRDHSSNNQMREYLTHTRDVDDRGVVNVGEGRYGRGYSSDDSRRFVQNSGNRRPPDIDACEEPAPFVEGPIHSIQIPKSQYNLGGDGRSACTCMALMATAIFLDRAFADENVDKAVGGMAGNLVVDLDFLRINVVTPDLLDRSLERGLEAYRLLRYGGAGRPPNRAPSDVEHTSVEEILSNPAVTKHGLIPPFTSLERFGVDTPNDDGNTPLQGVLSSDPGGGHLGLRATLCRCRDGIRRDKYQWMAVVITKTPETVVVFLPPLAIFPSALERSGGGVLPQNVPLPNPHILIDSHPREHSAGAYAEVYESMNGLVEALKRIFPVTDLGSDVGDVMSMMYNSFDAYPLQIPQDEEDEAELAHYLQQQQQHRFKQGPSHHQQAIMPSHPQRVSSHGGSAGPSRPTDRTDQPFHGVAHSASPVTSSASHRSVPTGYEEGERLAHHVLQDERVVQRVLSRDSAHNIGRGGGSSRFIDEGLPEHTSRREGFNDSFQGSRVGSQRLQMDEHGPPRSNALKEGQNSHLTMNGNYNEEYDRSPPAENEEGVDDEGRSASQRVYNRHNNAVRAIADSVMHGRESEE